MELPPRARRIRSTLASGLHTEGTTSACAENTIPQDQAIGDEGNYLRVRGEYAVNNMVEDLKVELPPRARRILLSITPDRLDIRTTSACAENTLPNQPCYHRKRNYLRVRGEYPNRASSPN